MLKILIVDDEKYIRDELKYFLGKIHDIKVVGETGDGDEVIELVDKLQPDLVFMDIQLQDINGMILSRKILERSNPPYIILATSYDKYAIQGFEINVEDYILKPFSEDRLRVAIERVRKQMKLNTKESSVSLKEDIQFNKLCVMKNSKLLLINLEEIQYIESENNEIIIYTRTGLYSSSYSLKELEEKFHDSKLIRTHKSYIVNIDYIDEIIPWFNYTYKVKLKGKEDVEIPISRNYLKRFKGLLGI